MKNKTLLPFLKLILVTAFLFSSCEKENDDLPQEQTLDETEISSKMNIGYQNVFRFYFGPKTIHTYRASSGAGTGIGNREGIAFITPLTTDSNIDTNAFHIAHFMIHPKSQDFVIVTNPTEFNNLVRAGWGNTSRGINVLIHKKPGGGRKKLYRFYHAKKSDHLFTKNYAEGRNAGFTYEGVVGWVY